MVALIADALGSPVASRRFAASLLLDLLRANDSSEVFSANAQTVGAKQVAEVAKELRKLIEEHALSGRGDPIS